MTIIFEMDMANTQPFSPEAFEPFRLAPTSNRDPDWSKPPSQDPLPPPIQRARVMSAQQRRLHNDRIRQLYVNEGKSIDQLRIIVNREFNLEAK